MDLGEVLISESEIAQAVAELAVEIGEDYDPVSGHGAGLSELVLVGAMDGAVCFLADLIRAFPEPVNMATARVRSYEGADAGEVSVRWLPPRERIEGRHALIVEGIMDTGATCARLAEGLSGLGALSVKVCTLLDKPSGRTHEIEASYIGFDVPDVFVVGYGLDYDGAYRGLRDVYEMEAG